MILSEQREASLVADCEQYLRDAAPYRTGNLSLNAIIVDRVKPHVWKFWVSGDIPDIGVAPYAPYTNENWNEFKEPLKGKINPNEGWFDRAAEHIVQMVATAVHGKVR